MGVKTKKVSDIEVIKKHNNRRLTLDVKEEASSANNNQITKSNE